MKLEQYLRENDIKPVAFAISLEVAPSTITRILRGERSPRVELVAKIQKATGGKVTVDDFIQEAAE